MKGGRHPKLERAILTNDKKKLIKFGKNGAAVRPIKEAERKAREAVEKTKDAVLDDVWTDEILEKTDRPPEARADDGADYGPSL